MSTLIKIERVKQLGVLPVVIPLIILIFIWLTTPLTEKNLGYDSDGRAYGAMAKSPYFDKPVAAPWCWRVLTPYLVSLLPFSTLMSFKILAFFSNWLSLVLLYGILRKNGYSDLLSIVGILFYAGVFWAIKFSFYSPAYIDFQTQTFILTILFFTLIKKYWILPILLTIGVLQKESIIFWSWIVYVCYTEENSWFSKKSIKYLIILLCIPILAIVITRIAITPSNDYSSLIASVTNLIRLTQLDFWPRFALAIFSGLGILPIMLLYKREIAYRFLYDKPFWRWQILIGMFLLIGGIDKARLFLYMLPAIIIILINSLESILSENPSWKIYTWIIFTLILHFYLGYHLTPMGSFDEYLNRMVPIHAQKETILPNLIRIGVIVTIWSIISSILLVSKNFRWNRQ